MSQSAGKPDLRRAMLARVHACDAAALSRWDADICRHLIRLPEYEQARQLLLYSPLRGEVVLDLLLAHASAAGKRFYLPRVTTDFSLDYRSWTEDTPLVRSGLGVCEPSEGEPPLADSSLVVVPGLAFDRRGFRLGRGRGCFDRSLPGLRSLGPTVGVAYSCQLVDRVEREDHDVPVEILVTERGVMRVDPGAPDLRRPA
jgi:5-formyltetrahydrofolate cyclo-ligase